MRIWILDPGWKNSDPGIRHNHPGSATLDVRKKSVCQIFDEGREFPAIFKATFESFIIFKFLLHGFH